MADKRIADFPTLSSAQDTDLILVSNQSQTYNISFATLKEGTQGDPGRGITSYTEYYAVNNSTTAPADSAFTTTVVSPTASNRYLWNYTVIQYTDTTTLTTDKRMLCVYGERGDTGYYVTEITNYYVRSSSKTGVTRTGTSGWSTTVPELTETYKYLWSYTAFKLNDNSYQYSTACVVGSLGQKGNTGNTGATGPQGKGITTYTEYYATSSSGTTAPADADFSTTPPTLTSTNKYMWSYTVIGYNDSTSTTTTKHIVGVYGDKGDTGPAGATTWGNITGNISDNTDLQNALNAKLASSALLDLVYPVGSIYMSVNNVSPATFIGGTWATFAAGRVLVGVDTSDTDFDTVEKTGGEKTHTLTTGEMAAHTHGNKSITGTMTPLCWSTNGGTGIVSVTSRNANKKDPGSGSNFGGTTLSIDASHEHSSVGSDQAHNNLQPYITCYIWKRTA